jgi:uncharacterized protein (DUF1800 family)
MAGLSREQFVASSRFGYGVAGETAPAGSPQELLRSLGSAPAIPARLAATLSQPRLQEQWRFRQSQRELGRRKGEKKKPPGGNPRKKARRENYYADAHNRLLAAVEAPCGFFERLVSFWSNHFTVNRRKNLVKELAGPFEVEAIRPNITRSFADLLIAAVLHPAMLVYLDQDKSVGVNSVIGRLRGRGLNENLGREVLELHTVGVQAGYSQDDVTGMAKVLTGWTIDLEQGKSTFDSRRAEPGRFKVLGRQTGASEEGRAVEALRALSEHPATSRHVARKLLLHFASDDPDDAAVEKLAATFMETRGDLPQVYLSLASRPEVWTGFGDKARSDFEFVVSALRTARLPAGVTAQSGSGKSKGRPMTVGALADMEQRMWDAPSPAGWPERASEWLSPVGLAQRLNWIPSLVQLIPDTSAVDYLDRVLGPLASANTRSVISSSSNREEGIALVLASAEFNRR